MLSNHTRKWIRTGIELCMHGFWAAVLASGTAYWIDPQDWAIWSAHFFKMFGGVFFLQGGLRAVQFYMNNPLPTAGDTTPPIPGVIPTMSLNPLTKVQQIPKA